MTDRFSKLYKESAVAKKLSRNFQQLFKSQKAVEANGNGTSGIKITEGVNQGKILGHKKTEAKKTSPKKEVSKSTKIKTVKKKTKKVSKK